MSNKPPQKESPSQGDMPDTGAKLDAEQHQQLTDILGSIKAPSDRDQEGTEGKSEEEILKEQESFLEKNPERSAEAEEPDLEEEEDQDDEAEDHGDSEADDEEEREEEEVELDEVAQLRLEIAQLKAAQQQTSSATEEAQEEGPKFDIDGASFLTEEEAEELYSDPRKVLSTVLARVYAKAREDTYKEIPSLIEAASERQQYLREARTKFWSENGDLLKITQSNPAAQAFLRSTADQVQSENPGWPLGKIFEETGKRVRAAFNMSGKAREIEKGTKKPSGPPRRPRGHRKVDEGDIRSGLQKQIDSLIEER